MALFSFPTFKEHYSAQIYQVFIGKNSKHNFVKSQLQNSWKQECKVSIPHNNKLYYLNKLFQMKSVETKPGQPERLGNTTFKDLMFTLSGMFGDCELWAKAHFSQLNEAHEFSGQTTELSAQLDMNDRLS